MGEWVRNAWAVWRLADSFRTAFYAYNRAVPAEAKILYGRSLTAWLCPSRTTDWMKKGMCILFLQSPTSWNPLDVRSRK